VLAGEHDVRPERLDGGGEERGADVTDVAARDPKPPRRVAAVAELAQPGQPDDVDAGRDARLSADSALVATRTDAPGDSSATAPAIARSRRTWPSPTPSCE